MLSFIAIIISTLSVFAMVLPWVPSSFWLFRVFDYPRLQIAGLHLVSILLLLLSYGFEPAAVGLSFILLANIAYQVWRVFPYTSWAKLEVPNYKEEANAQKIRLLVWNVYQFNHQTEDLPKTVKVHQPDVILLCETNDRWCQSLQPLHASYPHRIEIPLENTYGMCMLSRHPFLEQEVNYLVNEEVPSIYAQLELTPGRAIDLYAIHPVPPVPKYGKSTDQRDAEVLRVGKRIANSDTPTLVFGDFNDVAWSRLTIYFQKLSGMLDLRRGRAIIPTFPTHSSLLRVPIDQVYCSPHFSFIHWERLDPMGSDHFPVLVELALTAYQQSSPPDAPNEAEKALIEERLESV